MVKQGMGNNILEWMGWETACIYFQFYLFIYLLLLFRDEEDELSLFVYFL